MDEMDRLRREHLAHAVRHAVAVDVLESLSQLPEAERVPLLAGLLERLSPERAVAAGEEPEVAPAPILEGSPAWTVGRFTRHQESLPARPGPFAYEVPSSVLSGTTVSTELVLPICLTCGSDGYVRCVDPECAVCAADDYCDGATECPACSGKASPAVEAALPARRKPGRPPKPKLEPVVDGPTAKMLKGEALRQKETRRRVCERCVQPTDCRLGKSTNASRPLCDRCKKPAADAVLVEVRRGAA